MRNYYEKKVDEFFNGNKGLNCAQSVLLIMTESFKVESEYFIDISRPFGGGIVSSHRSVCGAVSGGLMFIGIMDKETPNQTGDKFLSFVSDKYNSKICDKILDIDFDNQKQVDEEKSPKKESICTPLLVDICVWLDEAFKKNK